LKEKTDELNGILAELDQLNRIYNELVAKVNTLKENLREKENYLKMLEDKITLYKKRLEIATKLTKGLAQAKVDWINSSKVYNDKIKNIEGDVLISCGVFSYLGAFTKGFRDLEIENFKSFLSTNQIQFSDDVNLQNTLGDPIEIQSWTKAELPSDNFTIENTVIMHLTDK